MISRKIVFAVLIALPVLTFGCGAMTYQQPDLPTNYDTVQPGSRVTFKGKDHKLLGEDPIAVGKPLPSVALVDSSTMKPVDLSEQKGEILFLSIVPSVDTKVCEAQTHYLAEEGDKLPDSVKRITISRDTPFAHQRFSEAAGLTDIQYLSDYKNGAFGRAMGLLVDDLMLLARSVILVGPDGKVEYIQVVPEMTNLPAMEEAFNEAIMLAGEKK